MNRFALVIACGWVLLLCGQALSLEWDTCVFRDDFDGVPVGDPPDGSAWVLNHPVPDDCWQHLGRTFFPNQECAHEGPYPRVENVLNDRDDRVCVIEHHSYNPYHLGSPKTTFLGGEIHTVLAFHPYRPHRFEARVRCQAYPGGLVTSFFTYGYDGANSDEVDFEFVSSQTDDGTYRVADPVLTNPWNESQQKPRYAVPDGLDLTQWNTFRIYWYPEAHRVDWTWVTDPGADTEMWLRTESDAAYVPDEPMSLYFNFWAPTEDWAGAYDADLQPAQDPGGNVIYRYEIDYAEVRMTGRLPGNANADGWVDGLDYNVWSLHYLECGHPAWSDGGWTVGNFNEDDCVDGLDYNVWSLYYNAGCDAAGADVPEPVAGALLMVGFWAVGRRPAGLTRRRTRRRSSRAWPRP